MVTYLSPQILIESSTPVGGVKMIIQVPALVWHNTAPMEYQSCCQEGSFEKLGTPLGSDNWVGITTFSIGLFCVCVCVHVCVYAHMRIRTQKIDHTGAHEH